MRQLWDYVLCFGDSLTYGARDEFGRGYPAELADILHENTGQVWICFNEGVNGETSSDLLRRSPRTIRGHSEARVVTLLIGTNDTKLPTPAHIYKSNITQILQIARVTRGHVVLGLLPPLKFNPNYSQENAHYIDLYNGIIKELANAQSLKLADFTDMGEFLIDGVHFGNKGYKEMARRWADTILGI
jgi:lysophospholipase L1-like esterase